MESQDAKTGGKHTGRPLAPRLDPDRVRAARERLALSGKTIADWATEHRVSPRLVGQVLGGDRPCTTGDSHRIAVKLGLKDAPKASGGSVANLEPAR